MKEIITPLILGADLNAYNVARAFHEKYGVISHAFGRYAIGATKDSKIVNFTAVENLDKYEVMLDTVKAFAGKHAGEKIILLGCTDEYVSMIIEHKKELEELFVVPYIDFELEKELTDKSKFYKYCEELDIPYPKTKVIESSLELDQLDFDYPIIVKPAVSSTYWQHEFEGMKKVYRAKTAKEAAEIVDKIKGFGYPDKIIIQDTIPGDDSKMYVLTAYSGIDGKVKMMCLGHVILEEHTPKGLGNHCAIVTDYNPELCEKFKAFLEKFGYVGFANFDIKYDERDGSFRAFEINTRQGRSNYYVTASGANVAEMIVKDRITGEEINQGIVNNEIYWRYIPDSVVFKYSEDSIYEKINMLIKNGKAYSSMRYRYDLSGNLKRRLYVFLYERRQIKKFNTYYHPEQQ